jgi:hypothetical protein
MVAKKSLTLRHRAVRRKIRQRRLVGKATKTNGFPDADAVFPLHDWRHCILIGTFGKINNRAKEKTLLHFSSIRKR